MISPISSTPQFPIIDAHDVVGARDIAFITLDTLRFDVAEEALRRGLTPQFARLLPGAAWQRRFTPGSFTYAAHHAFFAGFLPTPAAPGKHPRLFAAQFPGSETATRSTFVFPTADIVSGLRGEGYHTACVGGVGFFNLQSPLGRALPEMFAEYHWREEFGVTHPQSTERQVVCCLDILQGRGADERLFLFLNVSALHDPNRMYLPGATADSRETQMAALGYVDGALRPLWEALAARGPAFCVVCSDHGTCYGEDEFYGHRLAHPHVWTVPYAEFFLDESNP